MSEMKISELYTYLAKAEDEIRNSTKFQSLLATLNITQGQIEVIFCYGLGPLSKAHEVEGFLPVSESHYYRSIVQLGFLRILARHLGVEKFQLFFMEAREHEYTDTNVDKAFLEELGHQTMATDDGQKMANQKTFFYLPFVDPEVIFNILQTNFQNLTNINLYAPRMQRLIDLPTASKFPEVVNWIKKKEFVKTKFHKRNDQEMYCGNGLKGLYFYKFVIRP